MDIVIENKEVLILNNINRIIKQMLVRYREYSTLDFDFVVEEGKKYYKIINGYVSEDGRIKQRGVHAFVDKSSGDMYKPASWRAPAKGVRFNVLNDVEMLEKFADWAGSYLYRR
jgi:hypothetical protein